MGICSNKLKHDNMLLFLFINIFYVNYLDSAAIKFHLWNLHLYINIQIERMAISLIKSWLKLALWNFLLFGDLWPAMCHEVKIVKEGIVIIDQIYGTNQQGYVNLKNFS